MPAEGVLRKPGSLIVLFLAWMLGSGCAGPGPRLSLTHGPAPDTSVCVLHLSPAQQKALDALPPDDPRWPHLLRLSLASENPADASERPSMLGAVVRSGDSLRLDPAFPLQRGHTYQAVFDPRPMGLPGKDRPLYLSFIVPPESHPAPQVTAVFPSADRLPENLLRIYIHFSSPMKHGDVYRHLSLLDAQGQAIELPFLELPEPLWNPDGTRLTLLFDPGRVKRGLKPHEESGAVLVAGGRYTLVIGENLPDAAGRPLGREHRKTFEAAPADRVQPHPDRWNISPPAAGSRQALAVKLDEPLDRAMLEHAIRVLDTAGQPVPGTIGIAESETLWNFTPNQPWSGGEYRLAADTSLEDAAGNSIGRPFERDLTRPADPVPGKVVFRSFQVR